MKNLMLAAGFFLGSAGLAMADPAAGTWKTEPGDTGGYLHVSIAPCGSALCGTIKTAFDETGAESPDYEHTGKRMIWDMKSDGGGDYSGGKIWAADSDKTYNSKMSLSGNALTVKGCVAGGLICRGQTWKRVN
ncbi:MAG: DUF2147 domain-containing protein [Rhodobacteraceae bacterium]|nr:DUF2147 domain-containing protein [Paracoccaceae bacterium]